MARECGLETVPVTGGMMGLAVGSTRLARGRVETYPFRLGLSPRERLAFARAGLKVQRAVARYHRLDRRYDFEDDRTFGEFLGPLPPAVHEIFSCAAHRATAELDELSAGCGIGLFALVWGGKGSLIARNMLGGAGRLPEALGRELGERARTGARVRAIDPEGDELVVRYGDAGGPRPAGDRRRAGAVRGVAGRPRRRARRGRALAADLRRVRERRGRDV